MSSDQPVQDGLAFHREAIRKSQDAANALQTNKARIEAAVQDKKKAKQQQQEANNVTSGVGVTNSAAANVLSMDIASSMNEAARLLGSKAERHKQLVAEAAAKSVTLASTPPDDEFDEYLASLPLPSVVPRVRITPRPGASSAAVQLTSEEEIYDTMHPPALVPRVPTTPKPGTTRSAVAQRQQESAYDTVSARVSQEYDVVEQPLPETPYDGVLTSKQTRKPQLPLPRVRDSAKPMVPQMPVALAQDSKEHPFYAAVRENPKVRMQKIDNDHTRTNIKFIQGLAHDLSTKSGKLDNAPGFIKDDKTGIWSINPEADKTQINGPIFMSRIDENKQQVLDPITKQPVYDVLYYNNGVLDTTKSFVAPDDVPQGSRPTVDPEVRHQVITDITRLRTLKTIAQKQEAQRAAATAVANGMSKPSTAISSPLPLTVSGRGARVSGRTL